MDSAARCSLTRLVILKAALRVLLYKTMSTTHRPLEGKSSPLAASRRTASSADSDSDVEVLWSALDAGDNIRPRTVNRSSARLVKAKLFMRKALAAQNDQVVMSPQRNRFRVTDLRPPLPPEPPPSNNVPPPPPSLPDEIVQTVEKKSAKFETASCVKLSMNSMNTSAFLAAKNKAVLLEMRRSSCSETGVGGGETVTITATPELQKKEVEVEAEASVNRLEKVRSWVRTGLGQRVQENPGSWTRGRSMPLRLMSYNVLAQNLLRQNSHLYRQHDPAYLPWQIRWRGIQAEVVLHAPDIVCLQEVQFKHPNHYQEDYLPFFTGLGYAAVAKSRTGDKEDGCAIFYKTEKFSLEECAMVEYLYPSLSVLDRDNVGLICRLVPLVPGSNCKLVVGTTHILFNKKRRDIKLAQTSVFLAELDRMSYENGFYHPTLFTGDLNATTSSEVVQLITQGELEYARLATGRGKLPRVLFPPIFGLSDSCQWAEQLLQRAAVDSLVIGSGWLHHNFGFRSVYKDWEVSTYHDGWTTVDYIFYTTVPSRHGNRVEGSLKLVARYSLPDARQMQRIGQIPSDVCPSDHLPLLADFMLML